MTAIPAELRQLIETGPLAYLSTVNPDGAPQVTMLWIGLDGDQLVSGHMRDNQKLRNIRRDPRVVLALAPPKTDTWMSPYASIRAHATVEQSERAWQVMAEMAKVYVGPDAEFPAATGDPGYLVRYDIDKIGGAGPWVD